VFGLTYHYGVSLLEPLPNTTTREPSDFDALTRRASTGTSLANVAVEENVVTHRTDDI